MTSAIFTEDKQSRITRYGFKCFQLISDTRCFAYAVAKKEGSLLVVSPSFSDLINEAGESVSGTYRIVEIIGQGKINQVKCLKIS